MCRSSGVYFYLIMLCYKYFAPLELIKLQRSKIFIRKQASFFIKAPEERYIEYGNFLSDNNDERTKKLIYRALMETASFFYFLFVLRQAQYYK
jgi:hypothetical protein